MLFFGLDHHYCCQCGTHTGATREREGVSHTQVVLWVRSFVSPCSMPCYGGHPSRRAYNRADTNVTGHCGIRITNIRASSAPRCRRSGRHPQPWERCTVFSGLAFESHHLETRIEPRYFPRHLRSLVLERRDRGTVDVARQCARVGLSESWFALCSLVSFHRIELVCILKLLTLLLVR